MTSSERSLDTALRPTETGQGSPADMLLVEADDPFEELRKNVEQEVYISAMNQVSYTFISMPVNSSSEQAAGNGMMSIEVGFEAQTDNHSMC